MPQVVGDVMTADPFGLGSDASIEEAARIMRDGDVGDVIVLRADGSVCGIVTDRDIVVRGIAESVDPATTNLEQICSHQIVSVQSESAVSEAVDLMKEHDIRRLPVVDEGRLIGIVSLGDLAIERDPRSALADISEAPPNN